MESGQSQLGTEKIVVWVCVGVPVGEKKLFLSFNSLCTRDSRNWQSLTKLNESFIYDSKPASVSHKLV